MLRFHRANGGTSERKRHGRAGSPPPPDRPAPRTWRSVVASGVVVGLAAASIGGGAAFAAPDDRAEAEGVLLSGGGAINLDTIAALEGAYGAYPPASEVTAPIDVSVIDTIDLGLGAQLFGGSDVLTLGAVGQYQRSDATGAYAASGAIDANGAIAGGGGAPTTLDLTPVLDEVGAGTLISDLSVELGALAASAQATRTDGAPTLASDYQIAGGVVRLESPTLAGAIGAVRTDLTPFVDSVNELGAADSPIDDTVGGLLGGIGTVLEGPLGGLVDLEDPTVTTTLGIDFGAALDSALATADDDVFVSGAVTADLEDGSVLIDLAQLHDLANLAPNTELVATPAINAQITAAISDILTRQLPERVGQALSGVLDATALTIAVDTGVLVDLPLAPPTNAGDLTITIAGTLGGLLGTPGSTPPDPTVSTNVPGLDLALDPVADYVAATILPAVGDVVEGLLSTDAVEAAVTTAATATVTALQPLAGLLNAVVSITGNVQEAPGDFRNANGYDADSFTQRAVTIEVAPAISAIVLNLASATVRALPLAAPGNLAIDPVRGPVTGGTEVTITGTDLADVSGITFGGVPSGPIAYDAVDGSITTTTPPHTAGVVPVAVTNPDGTDATLRFEYFAASVDTITPDSGSTEGGDDITIVGECFTGATGVTFGGVAGTDFEVVSDTEITVTTPAGDPGLVDVEIVNPTDCGDVTVEDGFTYVTPGSPTLTDIDPDRGPETGDTDVTITGTDFTGTTSVTFGGVEATDFEVISDTEIRAVTPPNAPGIVDVVVTNGTGASAALDFEYFDVAEIDGVDPGIGPEEGGNTVVITGDCFTGATGVFFGGTPATAFTVDSNTQITATVPAGTGVVDVVVTGLGDCGTATDPGGYEYVPAPVITDLDPTSGPETGGTEVTITGSGFDDATGVVFDDLPGVEFEVVSDTEILVTTPAHAPGVVTVTVQHPGGDVDAGDFTFLNVPSITSLTPGSGPEAGGTVVTVAGEGFTGATGVTFDGLPGTSFTVDSDTQITVTTPPHAPATVDVVVEHPTLDSAAVDFVYVDGTQIDTITPPGGPEEGGTEVIITGACFTGATGVLFGATPATSFQVVSDTEIVAVAPAGTGVVDVTVVGAAACGTGTVPDGYEYTDDPVIGTIEPTRGPETGGTTVTITGANLEGATSVTFDGIPGTGLTVVSDTELTVTTPAGTPGDATVIVTSPDGTSDPGMFTYYAVTTIADGNLDAGPIGGGTTVSLIGHCFTGATAVLFGGVPATSFTVASDTVIRAVAPAGRAAGTVDVTVVGAGDCGTGVLAGGFTYQAGGALAATGGTGADLSLATMGGIMLLLGAGAVLIRRRRLA